MVRVFAGCSGKRGVMMKDSILIVPMKARYIPGLRQALDRVARETKYLLALKAPPLGDYRKTTLGKLRNKETYFIALDENKVVGWCNIRPDDRTGTSHIGLLYMGVLKDYRRRGIGKSLLAESLRHAKYVRRYEAVQLEVYASNKAAIGFYRKYGFKWDGLRKKARKYKGQYEDIALMSKVLKK
jgi:ribosomal protein S18 acetylase RimI-like enzyme